MPMSRMTELVAPDACATWLTRFETPTDASTAEKASSTGTPAATNAPKASNRMRNVIGSDIFSAREKSFPMVALSAWFALAPPSSSTTKPGCACWTAATASSTGCTRLSAVVPSPRRSNWTSSERPSLERTGVLTFFTSARARSIADTSPVTESGRAAPRRLRVVLPPGGCETTADGARPAVRLDHDAQVEARHARGLQQVVAAERFPEGDAARLRADVARRERGRRHLHLG